MTAVAVRVRATDWPCLAEGDVQLGTEAHHEHVAVDEELGDGGGREGDREGDDAEAVGRRPLITDRERQLGPTVTEDLNDLRRE